VGSAVIDWPAGVFFEATQALHLQQTFHNLLRADGCRYALAWRSPGASPTATQKQAGDESIARLPYCM
jgi:hypothetical protein